MIEFKLNERDYKMATSWDELTLERYCNLVALQGQEAEVKVEELYLLKIVGALCGVDLAELYELDMTTVRNLVDNLEFIYKQPEWPLKRFIMFNDKMYVFPQELNKITMGEIISIKTLQENKTQAEFLPYLLAIILRPGEEYEADGVKKYRQDKFNADDIELRRELFMELTIPEIMGSINFFLSGNNISPNNTPASTNELAQ